MNDLYLTDEDIHGVFDENAAREEMLKKKLDEKNRKLESAEDKIHHIKNRIKQDRDVTERCLKEDISIELKMLLNSWKLFDEELLDILSDEE